MNIKDTCKFKENKETRSKNSEDIDRSKNS